MSTIIRVLLLLDEAWNDSLYGNNNMTNWFSDFDNVELATVYCSPELPENKCCSRYFQITDKMMLDSILSGKPAGRSFEYSKTEEQAGTELAPSEEGGLLLRIKGIRTEFFRFCRDMLWLMGRYDETKLKRFLDDFKPDIIFSQRLGSVKLCRLERVIVRLSGCPLISYTGDNEYSLHLISFSPFFWIRRFMVRHALNHNIPMNSLYYVSSREQAATYSKRFGVQTKLLFKCGSYLPELVHRKPNQPIRIVYAGKLYCGRWKTLAMLAKAIEQVNVDSVKILLDIYTRDQVTKKQRAALHDSKNVFLRGAAAPSEISVIYSKADIALHVESFDRKNRLLTQHSYSTKVIDCLSSGCAVMAIGWEKHSACVELKKSDAAFVATGKQECFDIIQQIVAHPELVMQYAEKAMENIRREHSRGQIQDALYNDFISCIGEH